MLRDTLLLTVAKTEDEKEALAEWHDLFFRRDEQFGAEDEGDGVVDDQQDEQGQDRGQGRSEGQGQSQGQGRGQEPGQDEAQRPAAAQNQDLGPLARMLLSNDRSALSQAMNAAADAVNLQEIQFFTQRGIYSNRILQQMGAARLQRDIATLTTTSDPRTQRLMNARDALREAVRELVNRAILLYTREGTENLRNEILRNTALNNLERRDVEAHPHAGPASHRRAACATATPSRASARTAAGWIRARPSVATPAGAAFPSSRCGSRRRSTSRASSRCATCPARWRVSSSSCCCSSTA